MSDVPTSVYIIASGDLMKIGVARDPAKRLRAIKTGNPHGATLIAYREFMSAKSAYNVESRLHRFFHRYRRAGEWFAVSPGVAKARLKEIPELDAASLAQTSRTVWNAITTKEAQDEVRAAFARITGA
jgi:hypothetical protein